MKYLDFKKNWTIIITGMMLSGAIGNIIDRLFKGAVIDFISISSYPVFNIADCLITVGCIFLLIFYKNIELIPNKK